MLKATEQNIQRFWSDNPMVHPGNDFDWRTATPEEIYTHVEGLLRLEKGTHFQGPDKPILDNYIDYNSRRGATVLEIGYGVGWLLKELSKVAAEVQGIDLSESHFSLSTHRFRNTSTCRSRARKRSRFQTGIPILSLPMACCTMPKTINAAMAKSTAY